MNGLKGGWISDSVLVVLLSSVLRTKYKMLSEVVMHWPLI